MDDLDDPEAESIVIFSEARRRPRPMLLFASLEEDRKHLSIGRIEVDGGCPVERDSRPIVALQMVRSGDREARLRIAPSL